MIIIKKRSKKIIIVGGGITGLSAGINALLKGYNVEIYEKNNFPGGCCTGWERDGYYIDNCMHWLTGTNQHTKYFKLWKKLGAIDETSNLYQSNVFYKSTYLNDEIILGTNIKQLKENMIKLSPVDIRETNRFIKTLNYLIKANKNENCFKSLKNNLKGYYKCYIYYHKMSLQELSYKFKHPLLQKMFTDYFPKEYSALTFLCAYATFASGNGKVYLNGSKQFALNIAEKFLKLGGKIFYNSAVTHMDILDKRVNYIIVNNHKIYGDYLIYTGDPVYLFNNLIDNKYMPISFKKKIQKKSNKPISSFHVAIAVNKEKCPINCSTVIEIKPTLVGKNKINRLLIKDYTYLYPNQNKKVIQIFILQHKDDIIYWNQLFKKNKDQYQKIKQIVSDNLIKELKNYYPELSSDAFVLDSWTPITYQNFFHSYYGSYMGFILKKKSSLKRLSFKIKNVKNMLYASYWQSYMGGLPISAKLGECVVKKIK